MALPRSRNLFHRRLHWLPALICLGLLTSCGNGGGAGSSKGTNGNTGTTGTLLVQLSDATADQVAALTLTFSSLTLTSQSGSTVTVFSAPVTVEITRLAGTSTPLAIVTNIPQGTYSQMSLILGSPALTLISPTSGQPSHPNLPAGPFTVSPTLNPALTISSTPMVLTVDVNTAASLTSDSLGNISFSPSVNVVTAALPAAGLNPFNGQLEHVVGLVTAVASSSFTISLRFGDQSLAFNVDSNTKFTGIGGLSQLSAGQLAVVDGSLQSNGSFLAGSVKASAVPLFGFHTQGLLTARIPAPAAAATSFQMAARELTGGSVQGNFLGNGLNVDVLNSAYAVNQVGIDLTGLPFTPTFDATTIVPGQAVEATSTGQLLPATTTFTGVGAFPPALVFGEVSTPEVDLQQQPLSGTVSNLTATNFTLTVAGDSVFSTLTGATSVVVYVQPSTQVLGITLSNGASVTVRGLLFKDSSTYRLVAARVVPKV
ncbi:MAG TPA: DUF4382 domain-containing protein [Terriglobales bacterium]|nr:DUF4382 domain-containing protein [Terriglobales bacterium]